MSVQYSFSAAWLRSATALSERHIHHHSTLAICSIFTLNTLRQRQNGRHFADDIFNCIFLNENVWIPIKISLRFDPKNIINNIPALAQTMAWRSPGNKPLFEPMMVNLVTHICVTRPQWVNPMTPSDSFMQHRPSLCNMGHHWCRLWLVACSAPCHYLNQ